MNPNLIPVHLQDSIIYNGYGYTNDINNTLKNLKESVNNLEKINNELG
jgi:hypothetical protein